MLIQGITSVKSMQYWGFKLVRIWDQNPLLRIRSSKSGFVEIAPICSNFKVLLMLIHALEAAVDVVRILVLL